MVAQYAAWAQPRCPEWAWREVASHLGRREISLLHCAAIPLWAAVGTGQRTRRQLAAHAYACRRKPRRLRAEEDSDSEADDYSEWHCAWGEGSPAERSD